MEFLANHPQVEHVNHPSLADHPATTHSQLSPAELLDGTTAVLPPVPLCRFI